METLAQGHTEAALGGRKGSEDCSSYFQRPKGSPTFGLTTEPQRPRETSTTRLGLEFYLCRGLVGSLGSPWHLGDGRELSHLSEGGLGN